MLHPPWQLDPHTLQALNGMSERRTVTFPKNIGPNLDDIIRPQPNEELIKCSMVEVAESDAVADYWLTSGVSVRDDMGGIQQLLVAKPTKCALPAVGLKNLFSECTLMKPDADRRSDIGTSSGRPLISHGQVEILSIWRDPQMGFVIDGDREYELLRIVIDDENRPNGDIPSPGNAVKVDQGEAMSHRVAEPPVVPVAGIGASIAVSQEPIGPDSIIIRTLWRRGHGKRSFIEDLRLEDPLRAEKRHSHLIHKEAVSEGLPGKNISVFQYLLRQPIEGGSPHPSIMTAVKHQFFTLPALSLDINCALGNGFFIP